MMVHQRKASALITTGTVHIMMSISQGAGFSNYLIRYIAVSVYIDIDIVNNVYLVSCPQ